jgi:glycosyltransferase involved in cell wall biosynthesis/ribosomal protein S18 acetylase RimI-like enzyme
MALPRVRSRAVESVSLPRIAHVATVDLTLRFLLLPQLVALRDSGFEVSTISAPGPWVVDIEAEGFRHIPWHHATRAWDPREDALAFRELLGIFRRERFDVVHTHNPKPGVMGRIAARIAGTPRVVNTVHGLYATPEDPVRRRAPVLAAEWFAARFSDLELYQSAEDLAWARQFHVTRPGRALHLGNGIDLMRFAPMPAGEQGRGLREELGIGDGDLVVGTVGRMVREKGCAELFDAARIVRAVVPTARFLVVGDRDTDKEDSIRAEMIDRIRDDVIFVGWRQDVAELMTIMDIFALPSWREGLPRSAIEAAASALPLILTDIRGCREVVRDGVEGILVPVREPASLAEAILQLLKDPSLRERMGAAARARAEWQFDERRVAATVVNVTRKLITDAGRVPGAAPRPPRIRRAMASDAESMARLHRESMPGAFLPQLGDGFLRRLYRAMTRDQEAVTFVAEDRGSVVGFAAAVPSVRAFYRRFARTEGAAAGLAAAPRLARPSVFRRALETARHPAKAEGLPDAELLSIAVHPSRRSNGVGGQLARAVERGLAGRGVLEFKVVVGNDNVKANRFYQRLGFRPAGRIEVHEDSSSTVWVMPCLS